MPLMKPAAMVVSGFIRGFIRVAVVPVGVEVVEGRWIECGAGGGYAVGVG
jgi:hypothetical protein